MTKQTSKESNRAIVENLEKSFPERRKRIAKLLHEGKSNKAQADIEDLHIAEVIVYALRNDRIARTDEDVERLVSGK